MDSLITAIAVVAISIIATLLKKKGWLGGGGGEEETQNAPPPVQRSAPPQSSSRPMAEQRPPARAASWEEELRRLLEGQSTAPPVQTPSRPPPVVVSAPPPIIAAPPPMARPAQRAIPVARPVSSAPAAAPRTLVSAAAVLAHREPGPKELASMSESQTAYARASQLDLAVAEYIKGVSNQRVQATRVTRRNVSQEIGQVVSLFRNPRTARQAVLASLILGPPRAVDQGAQHLF